MCDACMELEDLLSVFGGRGAARALGLEDRSIADSQITANSPTLWGSSWEFPHVRLNDGHCWIAGNAHVAGQLAALQVWIQFDLLGLKLITGVAIQPRSANGQRTTRFRISTTRSPNDALVDLGDFDGNMGGSNEDRRDFETPVVAQILRLTCLQVGGNHNSMRMEMYGFDVDDLGAC